jgi:proteasome lid subunit RPN8/RPN11
MMTTPVFSLLFGRRAVLRFRPDIWSGLVYELARRAGGVRESGAFLLGPARSGARRVTSIVYYDDLDPDALDGGVSLYAPAFGRLWSLCAENGQRVIGDIHTHPGTFIQQSAIDRDNPMVARIGHIAIIVPNLAAGVVRPLDIGVHRYVGDAGWTSSFGGGARDQIYVGRWA